MTRITMATKKVRRYLKNRVINGSDAMYHVANSRIDHVTNRAIGRKIEE